MVGDFDTLPRYFQRSSICCEVLFGTESHPLDSGARNSCVHSWHFWFCHYISEKDISRHGNFLEVLANADYANSKATYRTKKGGRLCV